MYKVAYDLAKFNEEGVKKDFLFIGYFSILKNYWSLNIKRDFSV